MAIRIKNKSLLDIFILIVIFVQLLTMICGLLSLSNIVNNLIYYMNYIIIFLIIISLIKKGGTEHFLIILFYICFFIFLMGQKIFKEEKNVFLTFSKTELNVEQYFIFLSIIATALIFTYYSYMFFKNHNRNIVKINYKNLSFRIKYNKDTILSLIRWIFIITLPCALYMQIRIVLSRSALLYTEGYLENISIPSVIKIGYYLYVAFSLIYLSMKPSKKETYIILILMLFIEGGIQLIQGRRALFATTLFFVIWYLLKYHHITKIKFSYIFWFSIGGIMLIILFFFVEMYRSNIKVNDVGITYIIEKFMISTGGSDSVIANTIVKQNNFPDSGVMYILDPVINNPISIILTGRSGIVQGPAYLETFHSFSHWISYLTQPNLYFSGHGMGSCYLAEMYFVFGYLGVVFISIILGGFLNYMSKVNLSDSIFKTAIIFVFVRNIFTLPRDGLFSFFGDLTYLFIGFCIIYPFCKLYSNSEIGRK